MGDAYTPGLTVTADTVVHKTRRLPLEGTVLVSVGDKVVADQVVARTDLPGKVHLLNFANKLGVMPDELPSKLLFKEGEAIKKGDKLAASSSFFGLLKSHVESPIDGTLESVSKITGQAILREPPRSVEIKAYVDGTISEIIENEGVIVETRAALIQGIFGLAGEVHAEIVMISEKPGQRLEASMLTPKHSGKIVVGGSDVTLDAMKRALELKVAGVVVGGFAYHDIRDLLGYDIGVAVTGTEEMATTLVVTEGFGAIDMAKATFDLLKSNEGKDASITGATQIRAGVIRPEVVVPSANTETQIDQDGTGLGFVEGAPVRCIRAPYFGQIGTVIALPVELAVMPSETTVRVVEVQLENDETIILPRANVEVIER